MSNETEYRDEFWNESKQTGVDKRDRVYTMHDGHLDTEYRQDFTDPKNRKEDKSKGKHKKMNREDTEYNDEYNLHSSPVKKKKRERRLTKEWEDGFGQTEYRKDFTDPQYRKSVSKSKGKGGLHNMEDVHTSYRDQFVDPNDLKNNKQGLEDSPAPKIKVDMRTEYRTEFLDSDKKVIPSYSKKLLQDWKYQNHMEDREREQQSKRGKENVNTEKTPTKKSQVARKKPKVSETDNKKEKKIIYYKKKAADTDQKQRSDMAKEQAAIQQYQHVLKDRRNLCESKPEEIPQLEVNRPKNATRNLTESKDNPIDNWAYLDWKPSAENP